MDVAGRPPGPTAGRVAGWTTLVAALSGLNYAFRFIGPGDVDRDVFYRWDTVVGTVIQFGLMLGIVLWIVHRGPAEELLALRPPRSWSAAAAVALGVLVGVFALAAALDPLLHAGDEQGLVPERWRPEKAAPFAANFVIVSTFVPIVEELTFRGAGYALLARFGPAFAVVVTGMAFGLAHGLVRALPILVAFGIGLGILRQRAGSVYPCILLHGFFNGLSLAIAVSFGTGEGT